jgi:hypothetical protein
MTTTPQFDQLLAEYRAAVAEYQATEEADADRCSAAYDALLAARPTDPAALAVLVRWLAREMRTGLSGKEPEILEHVAAQLEALAGTDPPA